MSQKRGQSGWRMVGFRHGSAFLSPTSLPAADLPTPDLYLRFTLSYRDVEELLAERGLEISYERCGGGF